MPSRGVPRGNATESGMSYARKMGLSANDVKGLTDADIAGLKVIRDNSQRAIEELGGAIARALEEIGIEAEGDAKELCPVDTGRLRNSITHAVVAGSEPCVVIGTNVEYAEIVEMNEKARHKNGQAHYLRDGVTRNVDKYRKILERELESGGSGE